MDIDTRINDAAENLFDTNGFNATGMSRLIQATGLSSRTVYKHVASKNALVARVLAERQARFFTALCFDDIEALFAGLADWTVRKGARGCLFFRLQAETGGQVEAIEAAVAAYHAALHGRITALVTAALGRADTHATDQILALFEGATTAATYRGTSVIEAARACAHRLLDLETNP